MEQSDQPPRDPAISAGLNKKRISKVVEQFDELFTFDDHALGLEFSDKEALTEFFQKSRELFPDAAVEVDSTLAGVSSSRGARHKSCPRHRSRCST